MDNWKIGKWLTVCLLLAAFSLPALSAPPLSSPSGAGAATIDIVINENNPAMFNLARAAQHALEQVNDNINVAIYTPASIARSGSHSPLAIVIGDDLLAWSRSNLNLHSATVYFYVSSINYQSLKISAPNSALFRDQPLYRQVQLAQMLLPGIHTIAVIHRAQQFAETRPQLNITPQGSDVSVNLEPVDPRVDWAKTLSKIVSENDVLIGVDDREIYNRETIRSILLTTYRHGKVLIGPNRSFVAAGSLASTYTSPEHYLQQLQDMIRYWIRNQSLPEPQFPREYEVSVNRQVANSLGLTFPDDITLQEQLHDILKKQAREGCIDGC